MTVDWNHFTPWASLAGGLLLGLAASAFILINGRVLGLAGSRAVYCGRAGTMRHGASPSCSA
jgi:uncharacterized membrane protein YedE/YeeE